jgi:hypothetical protein
VRDLAEQPADRRRPDLECVIADVSLLADVQIIHPTSKSHLKEKSPHSMAARLKTSKYSDLFGAGKPHTEFVPLIFDAYGGVPKLTRDFFARIGELSELSASGGFMTQRRCVELLVSRVAIAIQRGNAKTVQQGLRDIKRD